MVNNAHTAHVATQLVRQFHRTALAHDRAEAVGDDLTMSVLSDRIHALEDEVSFHPAGSPEAALFLAQILRSDIDFAFASDLGYDDQRRLRRMERLTVSLVHYLERSTGIAREDFRLEWFGGRQCDGQPFGEVLMVA